MQACSIPRTVRATAWALWAAVLLTGCSALQTPVRPVVYDFGPGATTLVPANRMAPLAPLVLSEVGASPVLDGNALLYRLAYADAQQLRPYAQARWSMPPAQLLRQRVREQLGAHRQVLAPGELASGAPTTLVLRLELEEFSQVFDSPATSQGLVRMRATVGQTGASGAIRTLAQQSFVIQVSAPTADAAGGAKALAQASDALIAQLATWLQQSQATPKTSP
jgi:cholesterol transport system auxiliary component